MKRKEKRKEKIIRDRSRSNIVLACVYMNKTERQTPASQRKKLSWRTKEKAKEKEENPLGKKEKGWKCYMNICNVCIKHC